MIPTTWCLLETIDSFAKFSHIIEIIMINESQWLSHENIFKQMALRKSIFNIKLAKRPTIVVNNIKNITYSGKFENRIKNIMIINAQSLLKSFGNKAGFVPINRTIK